MNEFELNNKYENKITLTNLTRGINVKDQGLIGDGINNDYTMLNVLLTSIGSTPTDLYFPKGTYKISTSITFPANVRLIFENGAMLSPSNSVVITINGEINPALYQIFTGTGSVVGSPLNKEIYPEWFGAMGGNVDNTAQIRSALEFSYKRKLVVRKNHRIDTYIATYDDVNIEFIGDGLFDGSYSTNDALVILQGTLSGSPITLDADCIKATNTILVTGGSFVEGDLVQIKSSDLWNPAREYYFKGEQHIVKSYVGNVLTFEDNLFDSYVAATTTIQKVNSKKIVVDGLKIIGNNDKIGLKVMYARDFTLKNINIKKTNNMCLRVDNSFSGSIENCYTDGVVFPSTFTSYGLAIYASQFVNVTGGSHTGGRHGITVTGGTDGYPSRFINFDGVKVNNDAPNTNQYSFDTHGICEKININNCEILNGCTFIAKDVKMSNTFVRTTYYSTPIIVSPEIDCEYYEFENITIENDINHTMFRFSNTTTTLNIDKLSLRHVKCKSNKLTTVGGSDGIIISAWQAGRTLNIEHLTLDDIFIASNVDASGESNMLKIGVLGTTNIKNTYFNNLVLNGNHAHCRAIHIDLPLSTDCYFSNCRFKGSDVANYSMKFNINGRTFFDTCTFDGNNVSLFPSSTFNNQLFVKDCNVINHTGNGGSQYAMFFVGSEDTLVNNLNVYNNTYNVVQFTTIPYISKGHLGNKIFHNTASPTTGTYAIGDRVLNSSPSVGQPKGWVCTVAGTQGTLNSGATTGSITSGTTTLTVSSSTGLRIGQLITITGVSGVKKIMTISGTTVTIDSSSNATVSNAAVSYSPATLVSEGNL